MQPKKKRRWLKRVLLAVLSVILFVIAWGLFATPVSCQLARMVWGVEVVAPGWPFAQERQSGYRGYVTGDGKQAYRCRIVLKNHTDQIKHVTLRFVMLPELLEGILTSPIATAVNGADEPRVFTLAPHETAAYESVLFRCMRTGSGVIKNDRELPAVWMQCVSEDEAARLNAGALSREDWERICQDPPQIEPLGAIVDRRDANAKLKQAFRLIFGERAYGDVRPVEISSWRTNDGPWVWEGEGNEPYPNFGKPVVELSAADGAVVKVYLDTFYIERAAEPGDLPLPPLPTPTPSPTE